MASAQSSGSKSFLPEIAPLLGSQLRAVRLKEKLSLRPRESADSSPLQDSLYGSLQNARMGKRSFASFAEASTGTSAFEALRSSSLNNQRQSLAPSRSETHIDAKDFPNKPGGDSGIKFAAKLRRITEKDRCVHNKSISFLSSSNKATGSVSPSPINLNRRSFLLCTSKNYFPLSFQALKKSSNSPLFYLPKRAKGPQALEPCISTVNLNCKFPKVRISSLCDYPNVRKEAENKEKQTKNGAKKPEKSQDKRTSQCYKITVSNGEKQAHKRDDSISISSWKSEDDSQVF